MLRRCRTLVPAVLVSLVSIELSYAQPQPPQPLPPVPVPPENPITEAKRVLGKILFWEEQLSSDNTVACGTCHRPQEGGMDPRLARHPGLDGVLNTPDDVQGSPGVIRCDDELRYQTDPVFRLQRQITRRAANPAIMAMYQPDLFWDGRARTTFTDPQTGAVSIAQGGGLESQAVGPVLSDVEMGHEQRDWEQVAQKLAEVRPMILAGDLPTDMAEALEESPTYPELFTEAFGDAAITAERIAFAIATYERTLLPDETPWDRFIDGELTAMTPGQVQGWNAFRASPCAVCHTPPMFTRPTFENIGLRPIAEDNGRQAVTGLAADRGRFKVPTLRDVGLKPTLMHNGQFVALTQVIGFYANPAQQFPDNKSPLLPVALPPNVVPAVIDFLQNGLTDPRVANEEFPFDRPTLFSEQQPPNPRLIGGGATGTANIPPTMIALSPPNVMNLDFKIGVARALGGAEAFVAISSVPPIGGQLVDPVLDGPITLEGVGAGEGFGTWMWPLDEAEIQDCDVYVQWWIEDPQAAGGIAKTPIAHLRMIPYLCGGDMNCDGATNGADVQDFILALVDPAGFAASHVGCDALNGDFDGDGQVGQVDVTLFAEALVH